MCPKRVFPVVFFSLSSMAMAMSSLDETARALKIIEGFANHMCTEVRTEGRRKERNVAATANAEIKGFLRKLAEVGVQVTVQENAEEYVGFLQSDLIAASAERNRCVQTYFNSLVERLLPEDIPTIQHIDIRPHHSETKLVNPDGSLCTIIVESSHISYKCTGSR